jgi:hypothetical protein
VNRESPSTESRQDSASALSSWRQGDCALGVGGIIYRFHAEQPATAESSGLGEASDLVEADIPGLVLVTQTCDIQRAIPERPFVTVCALVNCPDGIRVDEIKRGLRPRYAFVPSLASDALIADLDQVMTVEKPLLMAWPRTQGCANDAEIRDFAEAVSRKFSRFAFPNDFVHFAQGLVSLIKKKHGKTESDEGRALRSLREIRVAATPNWDAEHASLHFLFVIHEEQGEIGNQPWWQWLTKWLGLLTPQGRFVTVDGSARPLSQILAHEYLASDRLDLDHLSGSSS